MEHRTSARFDPAGERLDHLRSNLLVLCAQLDSDQILALADGLHALIRERSQTLEPARCCAGHA